MTRLLAAVAALVVVALVACGPPPPGSVSPRDRDVLTYDEIVGNSKDALDLFEAIQALRPRFLEAPLGIQRGSAPQGITVYVNDRRAGGADVLRNLTAGTVDQVRYLGPTESQQQFGQTATLVTLMVRLRRIGTDTTLEAGGTVDRRTGTARRLGSSDWRPSTDD